MRTVTAKSKWSTIIARVNKSKGKEYFRYDPAYGNIYILSQDCYLFYASDLTDKQDFINEHLQG